MQPTPGALLAAASWIVLAWGFGFYLQRYGAKLDSFYGVVAAPIAFMIWMYWSSAAILLGAEINCCLDSFKSGGFVTPRKKSIHDVPRAA